MTTQIWSRGFGILCLILCLTACGKPDRPVDDNADVGNSGDPLNDHNFASLISKYADGVPDHTPWANTYWPYKSQFSSYGIASTAYADGSKLSPAQKYDKARGCGSKSHDWERSFHGPNPPNVDLKLTPVQDWWGHCNGWSAAASFFKEPPEATVVNGVTFTRSDVKALVTEAGMLVDADTFGEKVDPTAASHHLDIIKNNVLPDPFFLLLTTYMGKLKYVVNIDRFNGDEIWNQPLAAYHFDYPKPEDYEGADPSAPSVYRIKMHTKIWWADDSANPNDETPAFNYADNFPYYASRELDMEVWLDGPVVFDGNKIVSSGNVIVTHEDRFYVGGEWLGAANNYGEGHPNLIWIPFSFMDANNPTLNPPEDATVNPYVDHNWLVKHLINKQDNDGSTASDCSGMPSGIAVPSPTPSSSPSGHPTPTNSPTHSPRPTSTSSPAPVEPSPTPFPSFEAPEPSPSPTHHGLFGF